MTKASHPCNYYANQDTDHCCHPQNFPPSAFLVSPPITALPRAIADLISNMISLFAYSKTSCKHNRIVCTLLCLASFPWLNIFEIHHLYSSVSHSQSVFTYPQEFTLRINQENDRYSPCLLGVYYAPFDAASLLPGICPKETITMIQKDVGGSITNISEKGTQNGHQRLCHLYEKGRTKSYALLHITL